MKKVQLHYEGSSGGNVIISVSYAEKYLQSGKNYDFEKRDTLTTLETPRQLLQDLETRIVKETGERVDTRDIIEGTEFDINPKHRNYPRHIGFLPKGTLSSWTGKKDPKERKKVDEGNRTRHSKIFQAYQNFVQTHSSTNPQNP